MKTVTMEDSQYDMTSWWANNVWISENYDRN